ncbi:hypothetical protein C8J57DRAFT_1623281 [Mycena rebaudengoi]|nr:hypothetical protein C8J57DRAFT_1623281 [Mycena rebaudengoi]
MGGSFYPILHFHSLLAAWPPPLAPSRHGPCAPPTGLVVQSRLQHLAEPPVCRATRRFAVSPLDGSVFLVSTSFFSYPTAFLSLPSPPSPCISTSADPALPRSGTSPLYRNNTPPFALEPHMFLISPLRHISPAFTKCGILESPTQRRRSSFYPFTTAPDIFQGAGRYRSSKKTHPPTVCHTRRRRDANYKRPR